MPWLVPWRYRDFCMQTLNQLLTEIDGFQPTQGVVFMAATNRASLLDPALMRAGRFDRKITIPRPDAESRLAILKVHARKHKLADDVDLKQLAQDVPGLVGADLANLLNEAALSAVREQSDAIYERHIQVGNLPYACDACISAAVWGIAEVMDFVHLVFFPPPTHGYTIVQLLLDFAWM